MKPNDANRPSIRREPELEKQIAQHLKIFQISDEVSEDICKRMGAYVKNYLSPSVIRLNITQTPEEAAATQKVMDDIARQIQEWKDAIFQERLELYVSLLAPEAFKPLIMARLGKIKDS